MGFWATFWAMLADIWAVFQGSERKALIMTLWLAFFDQGMASTAIINYAPQILTAAGVESHGSATLYSSAITAAKVGCCERLRHQDWFSENVLANLCCRL